MNMDSMQKYEPTLKETTTGGFRSRSRFRSKCNKRKKTRRGQKRTRTKTRCRRSCSRKRFYRGGSDLTTLLSGAGYAIQSTWNAANGQPAGPNPIPYAGQGTHSTYHAPFQS